MPNTNTHGKKRREIEFAGRITDFEFSMTFDFKVKSVI